MLPKFIVNLLSFLSRTTSCLDKSAELVETHLDNSISESLGKLSKHKEQVTS